MDELSPEEIQLRANQVTDEVNITERHLGLFYYYISICLTRSEYLLKTNTDQNHDSARL